MKKTIQLILVSGLLFSAFAGKAQFIQLATDATGDGINATLLDGKSLSYYYSPTGDSLYFRVQTQNFNANAFGINIVMNVPNASTAQSTWWGGQNSAFIYNIFLTVWVQKSGASYAGTIGVGDPLGLLSSNYANRSMNNISIQADATSKTYTLGIKRKDIYNGPSFSATVIAAVGSDQAWNDDIPNSGSGSFTLSLPSAVQNPNTTQFEIYPNPSNGKFRVQNTNNTQTELIVFDMQGKQLAAKTIIFTGNCEADLSGMPAGIYFVQLQSVGEIYRQKIVLQ